MKSNILVAAAALAVSIAVPAQTSPHRAPAQHPKPLAETSMPLTDGEVRRIDKARNEIVLKHGDLPSLGMPAMTMAFDVADKQMLDALKVGAKVRFNANLIKGKATVTYIEPAP